MNACCTRGICWGIENRKNQTRMDLYRQNQNFYPISPASSCCTDQLIPFGESRFIVLFLVRIALMIRLALPVGFCLLTINSFGQNYGNEWINYAQQYYKIPITQRGMYRLTYQELQQLGLPLANVDPRRIQIFHRGVEQAITVSGEADAFFNENDYIEFYGKGNDGTLDSELYRPTNAQPHKYFSLYSDTTYYFLTWRLDNGLGKRMPTVTEANTNNLPAESYHWDEKLLLLTSEYDEGKLYPEYLGTAKASHSFYDYGEGWTGARKNKFESVDYTLTGLTNVGSPTVKPKLEVLVTGRNNYPHNVEIFAGPSASSMRSLGSLTFQYHSNSKYSGTIEPTDINAGNLTVRMRVNGVAGVGEADAASVSFIRLLYPQQWVMDNGTQKIFNLEMAGSSQRYVEIGNPAEGTTLYDITDENSLRRITSTLINGKLSTTVSNAQAILANAGTSPVTSTISKVTFRNFNASRPTYLIITHPVLRNPIGDVSDPVQAYADYRASIAGGKHDTVVANIDQLYNQFSYGEYTPLAIVRFVRWIAKSSRPEYLFIVGRGLSPEFVRYSPGRQSGWVGGREGVAPPTNAITDLVPAIGTPGSDFLFSDAISGKELVPALGTGRISALTPQQVLNYLTKVKEHEQVSPDAPWRKNILHLSGGRTSGEVTTFKSFIDSYKAIVTGKYFGGFVQSFSKATGDEVEKINVSQQLNEGVSLATMFGHSGRNINDIEIGYVSTEYLGYRNKEKYPFFIVNGCQSGDVFNTEYTYAEDWTMRRSDKGAVAWIAHSSFGYASELHSYCYTFYNTAFADSTMLGKPIGKVQQETIKRYVNSMANWTLGLTHAEQIVLQGDPAVALIPFTKPDYAVNESGIFTKTFSNEPLTAALDSFQLGIVVANYGKLLNKKFAVTVTRKFGDGTVQTMDTLYYPPVSYRDTLYFTIRNTQRFAGGAQTFTVYIDAKNEIDEFNEQNNQASREIDVPAVGAIPLFPKEYSIVSSQPVRFVAQSTITPLENRSYKIELDTAHTFDSPAKKETTVTGNLLINWETNLISNATSHDSTVYYWRISLADRPIDKDNSWTESSFIYINKSPEGWSQTKFPQFSKAGLVNVARNTTNEQWEFTGSTMAVEVKTYGYQNQSNAYKQATLSLNGGAVVAGGGCNTVYDEYGNLISNDTNVVVAVAFRRTTAQPYLVVPGLSCAREPFAAHYLTNNYINSGGLADFINKVSDKDYILLFTTGSIDFSNWSPPLKQLLVSLGGDPAKVANLKTGDPYIIIGQKGALSGKATEIYPDYSGSIAAAKQALTLQHTVQGSADNGVITSSLIGPASLWGTAYHAIRTSETPVTDQWQLDIVGLDLQGNETVVYSNVKTSPLPIDFINSGQYPYLKLRLQAKDATNLTPPQLKKWQVIYEGVPEGLINTSMVATDAYKITEQAEGATFTIPVVFQNISPRAFKDSLTVEYTVLNSESRKSTKKTFKIRPVAANGDTVRFTIPVSTSALGGANELQVFVNPRILAEQSYSNNVLTIPFSVNVDKLNPVMEVTFDGQRILDGEIVSPTPLVGIRLKDENSVLIRKDTSGIFIYLKQPGSEKLTNINELQGTLRWVPAGPDNDFRLEWQAPKLADGIYTLEVHGSDLANNKAGLQPYRINFEVVNESTITHFYPYPNPFSTSTRFVFTLTGAAVPDQIKIQIMTVSGKVVREITQDELGPVRIGNNVSTFVWDGSDEFGDKLANGVYLYRVFTRINGQDIERRATAADKAFKKEFGKMYILR
ncbi:C25 family cysteine peptidase [Cytophagaceae bacterium YF14B1]|uniref:C25 family cysteine peptidase n=1 Tax=Xanthocytophaga flava TaxID=3048013 RepID=A0AAE3R0P3_9BACT|nr:C25 family cysteine peptidase [Xanthocytophaga flavus]MDJ1485963.1 C25 family cysteine peptidase [Xanthocytophaga flavus]